MYPGHPASSRVSEEESIPHLRRIIEAVVRGEEPFHVETIDTRTGDAWNVGCIEGVILEHIDRARSSIRLNRDSDFLFTTDFGDEVPTRCHGTATTHDSKHVHSCEIEDTGYRTSRDARVTGHEDLVITTAKYLGSARDGNDVRTAVDEAIENLSDQGRLTDTGEWFRRLPPKPRSSSFGASSSHRASHRQRHPNREEFRWFFEGTGDCLSCRLCL